jgi:glycosyltransferase involved in cell wall biosynthesis
MDLSIIIPCYNIQKYLSVNVQSIIEALNNSFTLDYEIILVVDGSPGNTTFIAKELASSHSAVKPLSYLKTLESMLRFF